MPLVTFEKYMREQHGIEFQPGNGAVTRFRRGGHDWRTFEDDKLSSITGALLLRLRAFFPEADMLVSSPVVQVVRGRGVDDIIGGFDLDDIKERYLGVPGAEEQLGADLISRYDDLADSLVEGTASPVAKYAMADILHQLAVRARSEDLWLTDGVVKPPSEGITQFIEVLSGKDTDHSLKNYIDEPLADNIIMAFMVNNPEGVLSSDRTRIDIGARKVRLMDVLGLTPYDGLDISLEDKLPLIDQEVESDSSRVAKALAELALAGPSKAPTQVGAGVEGVQCGIEFVYKWFDEDVNSLDPGQRVICQYGVPEAQPLIDRMGASKKKRVMEGLPRGEYEARTVIGTISTNLRRILPTAKFTSEVWAMIAGSRVVSQKGDWEVSVDGRWTRRKGPDGPICTGV